MGRDKALLPIAGIPLGRRVVDSVRLAGATEVWGVGGAPSTSDALGVTYLPDPEPNLGPAAAIVESCIRIGTPLLVVACDLVGLEPGGVARFVTQANETEPEPSVAWADGQPHLLTWWRQPPVAPVGSSNSVRELLERNNATAVAVASRLVTNLNYPVDLERWQSS